MPEEKLILVAIISVVSDIFAGLVLSLLGIPDPTDLLTNTGIQAINATVNALPTNAPQQAYVIAANSMIALRFIEFAAVFSPFAILIGFMIVFLIGRNE